MKSHLLPGNPNLKQKAAFLAAGGARSHFFNAYGIGLDEILGKAGCLGVEADYISMRG